MGKLVLIVLLAVLAVFWLRHKALAQRPERRDTEERAPAMDPAVVLGEKMVACARCGLNVPQPEALRGASGNSYCGREHCALAGDTFP